MSTAVGKTQCVICGKQRSAVRCEGCLQIFCYNHLNDHRQQLNQQLDEIEVNRDLVREALTQQTLDSEQSLAVKQIDEWEQTSMKKIQEAAQAYRTQLLQYSMERITALEVKLTKLTDALKQIRQEDDVNEIDLNQFKEQLTNLREELDKPLSISIEQESATLVDKISVTISSGDDSLEHVPEKQDAKNELFQNEIESLEQDTNKQAYTVLETLLTEAENRCLHYQNKEIEITQQLTVYKSFVNELQHEIQDLTERLAAGAEEYKVLYRKYTTLECGINKDDEAEVVKPETTSLTDDTVEVDACPMCYWEFPESMTLDAKKLHIDHHFA
ncbi:unnamed protein product [Adineta steineri]|uniref:Uncharacterized protein n=1 Tax=Adineta steineri TaxID=433720 RepID=A0A815EQ63_9BILA|nr:unnamed protein product [Adineta steineri]CAF1329001.1 unnamed protein product [Adineta steineri]CAF3637453.1 unnamed protein product [Adineta steineri]CAF3884801.1 unnamed protein product [Adineta steineri]